MVKKVIALSLTMSLFCSIFVNAKTITSGDSTATTTITVDAGEEWYYVYFPEEVTVSVESYYLCLNVGTIKTIGMIGKNKKMKLSYGYTISNPNGMSCKEGTIAVDNTPVASSVWTLPKRVYTSEYNNSRKNNEFVTVVDNLSINTYIAKTSGMFSGHITFIAEVEGAFI